MTRFPSRSGLTWLARRLDVHRQGPPAAGRQGRLPGLLSGRRSGGRHFAAADNRRGRPRGSADPAGIRLGGTDPGTLSRQGLAPGPRPGALRTALRQTFADLLRANLSELEAHVRQRLRDDPTGGWQSRWRLIWSLLENDPVQLRESFRRILPDPPESADVRLAVVRELHGLGLSPTDQRLPLQRLLMRCGPADLDRLRARICHGCGWSGPVRGPGAFGDAGGSRPALTDCWRRRCPRLLGAVAADKGRAAGSGPCWFRLPPRVPPGAVSVAVARQRLSGTSRAAGVAARLDQGAGQHLGGVLVSGESADAANGGAARERGGGRGDLGAPSAAKSQWTCCSRGAPAGRIC